ncbi:hypothetical protein [Kiloniella sp.]
MAKDENLLKPKITALARMKELQRLSEKRKFWYAKAPYPDCGLQGALPN